MSEVQEQLNEVRERQLQSDLHMMEDPKGFMAALIVLLFASLAAADIPGIVGNVISVVILVALIGLVAWNMRRRQTSPSKRYSRVITGPLVIFALGALIVAFVPTMVCNMYFEDFAFGGTVTGALFAIYCTVGMTIYNRVVKQRLTTAA